MNNVTLILAAKGFLSGMAIAAPIGPVGVLVLRRSMLRSFASGVSTGLGATFADSFLAGALALGLASVSGFFDHWVNEFKTFGGFILIAIGWWVWRTSPPKDPGPKPANKGNIGAFATALALTLSNPMTIVGIAGVFAGMGVLDSVDSRFHACVLVIAVFSGSLAWWFILSEIGRRLRGSTGGLAIRRINQGCGIFIAAIGAIQLLVLAAMTLLD